MHLTKMLISAVLLSALVSCQTQKPVELSKKVDNLPKATSTLQQGESFYRPDKSLISPNINTSIYAANNYNGYFYENGKLYVVRFPKLILDEYMEGNYKIIKAR